MANRLHTLLDHIAATPKDSREMLHLKQRLALASLTAQFTLSPERLKEMVYFMIHEMHEGLAGRPSTLRMLPSFVYKRSTASANGCFYALDLGGTNFRVIRMLLRGGELVTVSSAAFKIPEEHMTGNAEGLFGFIAASVVAFLNDRGAEDRKNQRGRIPLGFTFSFPVQQVDLASGALIKWTKGFTASGVEGKDVVKLLQTALDKAAVDMQVVALCNDTVGTLIARFFKDDTAQMGVILGTGANACYWERASAVTKDKRVAGRGDLETVINMEFGNFDSAHVHTLPTTRWDDEIDRASPNPGAQRFEKLISGMYLGEIARRLLVGLSKSGCLPADVAAKLSKPYAFESKDSSDIAADRLPGLNYTYELLKKRFGLEVPSPGDRYVIRDTCVLVRNRAAQLAGMAIAATLLKAEKTGNATIAVDGSVYEKTPSFRAVMQQTISLLLGKEADVRLVLQRDGSGHGAGYIAALA